jgi:hypothetical protein
MLKYIVELLFIGEDETTMLHVWGQVLYAIRQVFKWILQMHYMQDIKEGSFTSVHMIYSNQMITTSVYMHMDGSYQRWAWTKMYWAMLWKNKFKLFRFCIVFIFVHYKFTDHYFSPTAIDSISYLSGRIKKEIKIKIIYI